MKVDLNSNTNVTQLEAYRKTQVPTKKETGALDRADQAPIDDAGRDRLDAKLTQTLNDTLKQIESLGVSGAEVHANVDVQRASGLLKSLELDADRPRLSPDEILKLADKVFEQSLNSPDQALAAFGVLNAERVSELIS